MDTRVIGTYCAKAAVVGVLLSILFWFLGNACGSFCDPHSFTNPFGYTDPNGDGRSCILVCAYRPHPLFYITVDLTVIMTLVTGAMYFYQRGKGAQTATR